MFEKGTVIGESVYLESSCNVECSVISGPSAAPPAPHADVAEEASRMTSWASWVHAALICLCSLAEAMSSHGVAPTPWAFSISSHVALMYSLNGDPVAERDLLISLVKSPMFVSLADRQFIDFLRMVLRVTPPALARRPPHRGSGGRGH